MSPVQVVGALSIARSQPDRGSPKSAILQQLPYGSALIVKSNGRYVYMTVNCGRDHQLPQSLQTRLFRRSV